MPRMRCVAFWLLVMLACAPRAHAQGLAMQWDDCPPVGSYLKSFACDSNTGAPMELVLSVVPPPGIEDFVGFLATVDFDAQAMVAPDWWDYSGCRLPNDLMVVQADAEGACPDISEFPFFFGIDYQYGVGYPGRTRLRVLGAISSESAFPLESEQQVTLCRVVISRRSSVGPNACAGCQTPVCIHFRSALLDTRTVGAAQTLSSGVDNFALWQQSPYSCPFIGSPASPSTWGAIKSLYR